MEEEDYNYDEYEYEYEPDNNNSKPQEDEEIPSYLPNLDSQGSNSHDPDLYGYHPY